MNPFSKREAIKGRLSHISRVVIITGGFHMVKQPLKFVGVELARGKRCSEESELEIHLHSYDLILGSILAMVTITYMLGLLHVDSMSTAYC